MWVSPDGYLNLGFIRWLFEGGFHLDGYIMWVSLDGYLNVGFIGW
jgi:hypothetical protein